jgi:DNA-directed RNA polymerase subunit E'/Rpb7
MFMLTSIEDSIRISPGISAPAAVAIEKQLQTLYFDKVVPALLSACMTSRR